MVPEVCLLYSATEDDEVRSTNFGQTLCMVVKVLIMNLASVFDRIDVENLKLLTFQRARKSKRQWLRSNFQCWKGALSSHRR